MRLGLAIAALLVSGVASAAEPEAKRPWPPAGPTWEVDPTRAFERARERKTGVFVYVATEACPHCVKMAREVWPKPEVIAACGEVVCLAVYRHGRAEDAPATTGEAAPEKPAAPAGDGEWAVRLGVRAYPQVRLLDGWARPLPSDGRHHHPRGAADVVAAVAAVKAEGRALDRVAPAAPPKALLARLSAEDRETAARPEPWRRARVWTRALGKGTWGEADLVALWNAEEDPVLRRAILDRIGPGQEKTLARLLDPALAGPNDYVRGAALGACERVGGDAAVAALAKTIDAVLSGSGGYENPNNVLCDAAGAARKVPDPRLVEPLARILAKHDANNTATLLAAQALAEIGKKHGVAKVREPLKAAKALPGALAPQIAKVVDAALGG